MLSNIDQYMKQKQDENHFAVSALVKQMGSVAYKSLLHSVRDGETVRIKRGVYARVDQLADTMIDVEAVVPGGVLCSFSAWNVHGLTTALPQAYHVAVVRGRKVVLPVYPQLVIHHISAPLLGLGVEKMMVSGYTVSVYNKERCVCDAVKFRSKVGMDICSEVVNSYLACPNRNLSLLMDYAESLRVRRLLEQYLAIKL